MNLKDLNIDGTWTLFLDRDGVLNRKIENGYVTHWTEFEFLEGALDAMKMLAPVFGKIILVTNQQGIGKRLYTPTDLELIHGNMLYEINYHGGRIDKIYFSPHLAAANHSDRKPGIGMALKAKTEFPEIDFERSLIVGDSPGDMAFGRRAGMHTVFISHGLNESENSDFTFATLKAFADELVNSR